MPKLVRQMVLMYWFWAAAATTTCQSISVSLVSRQNDQGAKKEALTWYKGAEYETPVYHAVGEAEIFAAVLVDPRWSCIQGYVWSSLTG